MVDASHVDEDAVVYEAAAPAGRTPSSTTSSPLRSFAPATALWRSGPAPATSRLGSPFQDWDDSALYPLVCAAAAWHWVPRAVCVDLAVAVLRPGGTLALCWNYPAMAADLRSEIEGAYAAHAPGLAAREPNAMRPPPDQSADAELRASGRFETVERREHRWTERFSGERYIDLLRQSVARQQLPADERDVLFQSIRAVINNCGGQFDLPHEADLVLARTPA